MSIPTPSKTQVGDKIPTGFTVLFLNCHHPAVFSGSLVGYSQRKAAAFLTKPASSIASQAQEHKGRYQLSPLAVPPPSAPAAAFRAALSSRTPLPPPSGSLRRTEVFGWMERGTPGRNCCLCPQGAVGRAREKSWLLEGSSCPLWSESLLCSTKFARILLPLWLSRTGNAWISAWFPQVLLFSRSCTVRQLAKEERAPARQSPWKALSWSEVPTFLSDARGIA
ncbi:uncharacterized protein LOC134547561 [Prinia subflava]|uniref:uncharacterized protein LOC134547561 n=1 Tax=Prinia subflava TaxID=208062 RepID=UPI002FE1AC38